MKKICREVQLAISDVFDDNDIVIESDVLFLLGKNNPKHENHAKICNDCRRAIEAQMNCVEFYADMPIEG